MVYVKRKPRRNLSRTPLLITGSRYPWDLVGDSKQMYSKCCIVHDRLLVQDWLVEYKKKIHPGGWLYYVEKVLDKVGPEAESSDEEFKPSPPKKPMQV